MCDARVSVVIFSSTGKMFEYCSPTCRLGNLQISVAHARMCCSLQCILIHLSLRELIEQYQNATNNRFEEINHDQQIFLEMTRMKNEVDKLDMGIKRFMGDDLSSLTLSDINDLEQQLEFSVNKVRTRKHELLSQQLDNLRRKEHILEDQNSRCRRFFLLVSLKMKTATTSSSSSSSEPDEGWNKWRSPEALAAQVAHAARGHGGSGVRRPIRHHPYVRLTRPIRRQRGAILKTKDEIEEEMAKERAAAGAKERAAAALTMEGVAAAGTKERGAAALTKDGGAAAGSSDQGRRFIGF